VEATLARLRDSGALDAEECAALDASARRLFFKERTYPAIVAGAGLPGDRRAEIETLLRKHQLDAKRDDALMLVDRLIASETTRRPPPLDWRLEPTNTWLRTLERAHAGEQPVAASLLS